MDEQSTETSSGRYAAYDTTYQRFVGGVQDTKAKAREAAKAAGHSTVEIREV